MSLIVSLSATKSYPPTFSLNNMPNLQRSPDGTLILTLTLPWTEIKKEYEHQIHLAVDSAELPGFRKGKAPRDLVEPKLDKNQLYSKSVEALLPSVYSTALKSSNLKPILYPRIKIIKGELNSDWLFEAITCGAPPVTLGNYQNQAKDIKTDKPEDRLPAILKLLLDSSQVTLPQILVEEEVNHRLANLTDNLTKLGMTVDAYLSAKKTTPEGLKAIHTSEATADLTMEFILQEIGQQQKLSERTQVLDFLKTL